MAFDVDEDILQDFLVEAGEILELLQEQLVELENKPHDRDLLNAIFRGFHTVKGGAGFLSLTAMVDACHGAENVFDNLRNGKRQVTPDLMDVILHALDAINAMFVELQNKAPLTPATQQLLDALHHLSEPDDGKPAPVVAAPKVVAKAPEPVPAVEAAADPDVIAAVQHRAEGGIEEMTDAEFDALMDELHGKGKGPGAAAIVQAAADGDITDDEFEALLDQLHGKGRHCGRPEGSTAATASATGDSDEISDDEFEALLDQLHGKGKGPAVAATRAAIVNAAARANDAAAKAAAEEPAKAAVPVAGKVEAPARVAAPAPVVADKDDDKKAAAADTTVRVDTARLDQIMNMVGELVLVRNRLVSLVGAKSADEDMSKAVANLDVVTADLQGAVMKTRMQPIKKVFGRFPRVVRDLARSLGKDINLELEGEETDLDKNLVEALADPLVHLVRNSVDHGIEMPDIRLASGKTRVGTVRLSASQEGDHILLKISDDGAGMDPEKLKNIAVDRGVLDAEQAARMSDQDAFNLIFAPGFSTKKEISDISGRGVGMDVVKTKITQLNGSVQINSAKGVGTTMEIKVPLTLAILPTLMVVVGKQTFAFPLAAVNEIFNLDLSKTKVVDGQRTVIVRQKAIPLFYLEDWLLRRRGKPHKRTNHSGLGNVVIVQLGANKQVGFVVDSLIGQEEVVIKPLGTMLQGTPGMAGATITSDGGIALILDVPSLLKHYAKKH
ncbi:MAG: chemotaxis protein CheA [Gammaproteobacteria bacterium]|nr:chemotaxis protein CheA [Gammaproteobacteria bacterium]